MVLILAKCSAMLRQMDTFLKDGMVVPGAAVGLGLTPEQRNRTRQTRTGHRRVKFVGDSAFLCCGVLPPEDLGSLKSATDRFQLVRGIVGTRVRPRRPPL